MTAQAAARFVVGIDLGTSNTVAAFVSLESPSAEIALLPIPQLSAADEIGAQPLLPSVRYHGAVGEIGEATWQRPWPALGSDAAQPAIIGRWARDLGTAVPSRLVASAKSWLSHNGVDRHAAILPWGAPDEVHKISPVAASASYLAHVKAAWDVAHAPQAPLERQIVVLTVPASFDEGARALTLEAARLAGLPQVHLLEEPKAAFHDWLVLQGTRLAQQLSDSRLVLVVDVGGGTTDLTLIRVEQAVAPDVLPTLSRIAVGEHLMLGGDNMDLALAHRLEPQFLNAGEQRLSAARFAQLVQRCRIAKIGLLAQDAPDSLSVTLLGGGSRLMAQTRSVVLTRSDVQSWIVEGFLPLATLGDTPTKRQGALRGFGLPYPADAAISRHLAQFLSQHAAGELPDTVLLNGGVFHAHALAERLTQQLGQWREQPVRVLHNPHPDWSVARGAAAYGLTLAEAEQAVRALRQPPHIAGALPRIGGGAARSYWLALRGKPGAKPQLMCLLPRGTQEGTRITLTGRRFALRLGQAVRFELLANSHGDQPFQAGQLIAQQGEGWVQLPPLATVLQSSDASSTRSSIEVQLQAVMTEVGTLEVRCLAVDDPDQQQWLLPFDLRAGTQGDADAGDGDREHARETAAIGQIERIFGNQAQEVTAREVRQLRQSLERILGPREGWEIRLLRTLFDALLERSKRRRRTAEHERVWLNLAGWCLRPGVGADLDEWRIAQIWQLHDHGLAHAREPANWTEWWVFWRRVAAGLNEAQQMQVLEEVAGQMQKAVQQTTQRGGGKSTHGSYEDMLRLFAAMEAVPWQHRQEMGQWMLERLKRPEETPQTWWAIGRIAARQPLAANAHLTMPPGPATEFLNATLAQDWRKNETAMFAAVQITRMTGDRARDINDAQRAEVLAKLKTSGAPARWIALVQSVQEMDADDRKRSFGDSLPPGLRLLG
ncbi:Hsp70 family protein [Diaphorobacter aerolatus]|uniref:Hsp70 family protein n=1 Tax=Diaphorobacter aerolatus TaxID=1288495 RepID=A0A7H0GP25_9BURK|nr:Hsp70 family protein [Diaphorobacter aerolatus]QNP50041.1 hsp70 family protein [Diaphorobacter aerolatus]